MATLAIHIVDSTKGMSSSSFTLSEADMQRLLKALNYMYSRQVKQNIHAAHGLKSVVDTVTKSETLSNNQICALMSKNIVSGLIKTVEDIEVEMLMAEARAAHQKLNITEGSN